MQETLGIYGSGAIATGLAAVAAGQGDVTLFARSDSSAERATKKIAGAREKLGQDPADGRAVVTTDAADLGAATYVVEACSEEVAVKRSVYEQLARVLGPQVILATTTSSLSVGELAEASGRPDRFAGLHVFNPVPRMDLIELAFPAAASEDTRARTTALCDALGKTAVLVPDLPGFVVNKLLFPYLFSAVDLIEETGLEPKAVDECMKLGAGHPMGPLALLDFVGLDVSTAIADSIGVTVPQRVRDMVAAGELGKKSGQGFYSY